MGFPFFTEIPVVNLSFNATVSLSRTSPQGALVRVQWNIRQLTAAKHNVGPVVAGGSSPATRCPAGRANLMRPLIAVSSRSQQVGSAHIWPFASCARPATSSWLLLQPASVLMCRLRRTAARISSLCGVRLTSTLFARFRFGIVQVLSGVPSTNLRAGVGFLAPS